MHGLLSKVLAFPIIHYIQSTMVSFIRNKLDIIPFLISAYREIHRENALFSYFAQIVLCKERYGRMNFSLLHWSWVEPQLCDFILYQDHP